MGKTLAVAATAGGALTGALWLSTARADAAAVRADPVAPSLTDPDVPGEQRWVGSADGTRLNVQLHGPKDAPAVVFSHGWTCSTRYWNPQVRALGADYRVITYDQRGHGASANNRSTAPTYSPTTCQLSSTPRWSRGSRQCWSDTAWVR